MNIIIKELKQRNEIEQIYPLISERNHDLSYSEFSDLLDDMLPMGYRCIAAFEEDSGDMLGVSGFWIKSQFYCRRSMRVDNFIVSEKYRGKGIGKAMLAWLQKEGRKTGCTQAVLDSLTGNVQSHNFYFREGFRIIGFHFAKEL